MSKKNFPSSKKITLVISGVFGGILLISIILYQIFLALFQDAQKAIRLLINIYIALSLVAVLIYLISYLLNIKKKREKSFEEEESKEDS